MSEIETKSKVKDGNFYVVQSFMVKELKLKGLELACYAIIYGFSQADDQMFTGSLQYLSDWTCSSKQAIMSALKKLVEKGFLEKKDTFVNGVKFVQYNAIYPTGDKETCTPMQETSSGGMQESCMGVSNNVDGGIQENCPNSLDDNTSNNIPNDNLDDNIDFDSKRDKEEARAREESSSEEPPNVYTQVLMNKKYISFSEPFVRQYNAFFKEMHDKYGMATLSRVITYFLDCFEKNEGKDENGNNIGSKYAYMTKSVESNLAKLTARFSDPSTLSEKQRGIAREWGFNA